MLLLLSFSCHRDRNVFRPTVTQSVGEALCTPRHAHHASLQSVRVVYGELSRQGCTITKREGKPTTNCRARARRSQEDVTRINRIARAAPKCWHAIMDWLVCFMSWLPARNHPEPSCGGRGRKQGWVVCSSGCMMILTIALTNILGTKASAGRPRTVTSQHYCDSQCVACA